MLASLACCRRKACVFLTLLIRFVGSSSLSLSPYPDFLPSSAMSLSKVPPEVLSSVLNNRGIRLHRRLHLRLLSTLWSALIEDGLKKETPLVIRDEISNYIDVKPDDLVTSSVNFTDEFIHTLARLFSVPTEVTFAFGRCGTPSALWSKLPLLFAHMTTANLKTLKLYGLGVKEMPVEPLAEAICALPVLIWLTLDGYPLRDSLSVRLLPHLAPVLSRLEKFACPNADASASAMAPLSPRCTHLMLNFDRVFVSLSDAFLRKLSTNLTHLHLVDCRNTNWQSLSKLHRLTNLTLRFTGNSPALDSFLLRRLSPFSRLTYVQLSRLDYSSPLALPLKNMPPLPSIKHLSLLVDFYVEDTTVDYVHFFKAIRAWFPSLAHFTLFCLPDIHPEMQASLGEIPFSVKLIDIDEFDHWSPDW